MITVISGTAMAVSPIVHGGEQRGTTMTEFRRVKAVVDGRIELLPVISGNSVRGQLRDMCAEFSLHAAGIEQLKDLRAFHLLFGGGQLVGTDSGKYIDVTEERRLRDLLPALSVFGGSVGNRILGGRLEVGEWIPICRETKGMLAEEFHKLADQFSIYDLLDIVSFTRRDDAKSRKLQQFLDGDTLAIHEQQRAARQEAQKEEVERAQQMRYSYEVLVPGTQFAVEFALHNVDEVEMGTFLGGLALFATRPSIGGRASSGMGKVKLDLRQVRIDEPARLISEIAPGAIEVARQHLVERSAEILALLEGWG